MPVGLALLVLGACPAPRDVTPMIHVDPRAAQRLGWFGKQPTPVDEPVAPPSARVHAMRGGEQLGGPAATGRPGDLVLENAEVAFVVGQVGVGVGAGSAESGGNVLDAADAHTRQDELAEVRVSFGAAPFGATQADVAYRGLRSGAEPDGSAWIEASGRGTDQSTLWVTTRYTLQAPDRALLVETTLENTGEATIELASLGDDFAWDASETVAPGRPRGFAGPSSGPYVGAVGRAVSYALTSTEGSVEAVSGRSWTRTAQRKKVTLGPRGRTTYARVLLVGERGDTASLVGELALAAGLPVGELKVAVPDAAPGLTLVLTSQGSSEPVTMVEPFEATLPAGRYWIAPREGTTPIGPLDVRADRAATATMAASPRRAATDAGAEAGREEAGREEAGRPEGADRKEAGRPEGGTGRRTRWRRVRRSPCAWARLDYVARFSFGA
jgi:hypothetical protein